MPKTRPAASTKTRSQADDEKVQLKIDVSPEIRKSLKVLAVELETSVEALVTQQLVALLKKHGK